MKALNLGSKDQLLKDFINCDINSYKGVYYLDVTKPFPNNVYDCDYIYSSHLIEHLSYEGFKNYLNETYKCLTKNGVHRICFPSLDNIKKMINNPEQYKDYFINSLTSFNKEIIKDFDLEKEIPYCFVINNLYTKWEHRHIYDVNTVIELIKQANYSKISIKELNESDVEIFKNIELKNVEYDKYKKYESSVIECIK